MSNDIQQEDKSSEEPVELSHSGSPDCAAIWRDLQPEDQADAVPATEHESISSGKWLLFGASRRGRSHAHLGTYREDAFSIAEISGREGPACWALAVSDGAGSCKLSRVGANLAVREIRSSLLCPELSGSGPGKRLEQAVFSALSRLEKEALARRCSLKDLSCTLLVLFWVDDQNGKGGTAWTFQAGDGLIAATDSNGLFEPLADQDGESFAGATHFFTGEHVWNSWNKRFLARSFPVAPKGFLVMSDGVSDDLVPYPINGPIILKELLRIGDLPDPGEALVDTLGYEKRGSFDDRTLVCALPSDFGAGEETE
jgi:hypothetical protein